MSAILIQELRNEIELRRPKKSLLLRYLNVETPPTPSRTDNVPERDEKP